MDCFICKIDWEYCWRVRYSQSILQTKCGQDCSPSTVERSGVHCTLWFPGVLECTHLQVSDVRCHGRWHSGAVRHLWIFQSVNDSSVNYVPISVCSSTGAEAEIAAKQPRITFTHKPVYWYPLLGGIESRQQLGNIFSGWARVLSLSATN